MSIFDGCTGIIEAFPGLENHEHLKQKATCRRLTDSTKTAADFEALISDLYEQIEANQTSRTPSDANWRSDCQTKLDSNNRSPETLLERAIAILSEKGIMDGWFNQVPVASGFADEYADKRAAIDLVHLEENHATLIELKWKSDTPVFAAFEILQYGLAYLFSYIHRKEFGYDDKELMNVSTVSLRVLAPDDYYSKYHLDWLQQGLDESIRSFSAGKTNGAITMNFGFQTFPSEFISLPFNKGSQVVIGEELQLDDRQIQLLISAVSSCKSKW